MTRPAERLSSQTSRGDRRAGVSWSPWRAVVGFGVVSLSADMVYEGVGSACRPLAQPRMRATCPNDYEFQPDIPLQTGRMLKGDDDDDDGGCQPSARRRCPSDVAGRDPDFY